jgi:hypothetical protein
MKKLIVVTGGTQGIGRATIEKFAAAGMDIATCSRTAEALAELKTSLEASYPGIQVYTYRADVAVKEEVKAFCAYVNSLNRPVDVLVNNAGYFVPGAITTEPEGLLESMINANLFSAYHTTRGLIDRLIGQPSAHIFNVCSIASIQAYPNGGAYAISKTALLGFSRNLREELKPKNVRVTAVLPGATRTASWNGTPLPDERFISPEDVAEAIFSTWSLSPRSVVEEILIRPQLGDI